MRCLQIARKALSVISCSFYPPNEGPDTSVWTLILGGIRCAALHPSAWPPGSCGLVARHVPTGGVGDLRSHLVPLLPPSSRGLRRQHVIAGEENTRWLIKIS